jgi:putative ABC transport system permease protein
MPGSLRSLVRSPWFTGAAVATLALGLAGTTAVFSLVRAILLHPLPYRDPARLAVAWQTDTKSGVPFVEVSLDEYEAWRDQAKTFSGAAAMTAANFRVNLSGRGEAVQLEGALVSGNFFTLLGVTPLLGRTFLPEEDRPGGAPVVVISNGLWKRQFGADAGLIGRSILLDGAPATVIGVLPPEATLPHGADLWGAAVPAVDSAHDLRIFKVLARLSPGVSLEKARAEMETVAAALERKHPEKNRGIRATVVPLSREVYGDTRPALLYLLGAVGFVLLIACANVANLQLARAAGRRHEMSVRAAIGASRGRLVAQLLAESALLSAAGAAIGLALSGLAIRALASRIPSEVPRLSRIGLDLPVVAFAVLAAGVTVVLSGLVPALRLSAAEAGDALREGTLRSSEGRRGARLRGGLVVAEVALSLVLLASAALMVRSYSRLAALEPGFDPKNLISGRISLSGQKYADVSARAAFFDRMLQRLGQIPGVASAGLVLLRPLADPVGWDYSFTVEGQNAEEQSHNPASNYEAVSAGYFRTLQIPLKRGRFFDASDRADSPPVVIVNESTARRFWPGRDPIGRRLRFGRFTSQTPWHTVVGVVGDVRYREWSGVRPDIYVPYAHWNFGRMDVLVRTSADPDGVVPAVRAAVAALDPDQPLASITTMERVVREATAGPRFTAALLSAFGLAALLLAAVGISGVLSGWAASRTREFGIRMALGAGPREVSGLVLGHALGLVGAGVLSGVLLSALVMRSLSGLLYGVRPGDPGAFLASAAALFAVALAAAYLPARRASRADPIRALRQE